VDGYRGSGDRDCRRDRDGRCVKPQGRRLGDDRFSVALGARANDSVVQSAVAGLAHGHRECVPIDELLTATRALALIAIDHCGLT
jgi:hypothetical protein